MSKNVLLERALGFKCEDSNRQKKLRNFPHPLWRRKEKAWKRKEWS